MRCNLLVGTILTASLLFCSGCYYFVPKEIKREVSLMRVIVETEIAEIEELEGDAAKAKALRTLRRLKPHVVNVDQYMQGKKAQR